MDVTSPIEAFLTGCLNHESLFVEVDRVIREGSESDRTVLISDWRTKSGRIRNPDTKRKLDERVQPIAWAMSGISEEEHKISVVSSWRPLEPGDILARRFVIESKIGSGGMSTVFRARDLRRAEAQDRN